MSKDKMKLNDGGKITLDGKSYDFGAKRTMSNGNVIDMHSHHKGEVYMVIATNLQNKEQGPVKTQHAYSKEAMMSIVVLFNSLEKLRESQIKLQEDMQAAHSAKEKAQEGNVVDVKETTCRGCNCKLLYLADEEFPVLCDKCQEERS